MASLHTALLYNDRNAVGSSFGNPILTGATSHVRRTSLSSFPPSSRSESQMSHNSRPSRSPQPPPVLQDADRRSNPSSKSKTSSTGTGSSSQHSSLSAGGVASRFNPAARSRKKLRSQYPRGSNENHVEYILVAAFDIDRGPVMEHQYPVAITGDEAMLAELMLPDQAHLRNQDWTMFFLHKDTSQEEEDAERKAKEERRRRRRRKRMRAAGIPDPQAGGNGEHDGLNDDDDWDDNDESSDSEPEGGEGAPLIYVLNLVNTKQDKTQRRGAVVKAMAICTRHPFLHIYKVRHLLCPTSSHTDSSLALVTPCAGGVLQVTGSPDARHVIRGCQCHGPIADAQVEPT